MKLHQQGVWKRRGVSLLWDPAALREVLNPSDVVSIRQFFDLSRAWPEELPSSGGDVLVVAGMEGCLDVLEPTEAETWLEADLKTAILDFQHEYEGSAALMFWLPSGRRRLKMGRATEEYFWLAGSTGSGQEVPLGRCLWGGAEADVARIMLTGDARPDADGEAYAGLYHPRIS